MATTITTRGTVRALLAANVSLDEVLSSNLPEFKVVRSEGVVIVTVEWDTDRSIVSITDAAACLAVSNGVALLVEIERSFAERIYLAEFRTRFRRIQISWDPQIGAMHVSVK